MATLVAELENLVSAFEKNKIEYALCGGLAMAAHGFVRATMDIDFLIPPKFLDQALHTAAELGFDVRGLDLSFKDGAVEIRRVSKLIGEDVLPFDLILVTPQLQEVWTARRQIDLFGEKVSVVSREGLIQMKTLSGRPQDLADIYRLENEED